MPQDGSGDRLEGDEVAEGIAGEEQVSGGGQDAEVAAADAGEFVGPLHFTGFVVDGFDGGFRPEVVLFAGEAFGLFDIVRHEEQAVVVGRAHVEQARLRTEGRRSPVGAAGGRGHAQNPVWFGVFVGIRNGLAALVFALRPVQRHVGLRQNVLAGDAIEQKEVTVAAGLRDEFAGLAVDDAIDQNGRLHGIPVMRVMRGGLEIPGHLAGVRIEGDDGAGVKVVALAALSGEDGIRVAGAEVVEIEFRIVGARHPGHAAAVFHGVFVGPRFRALFADARGGVPVPLGFAGLGVAGFEVARDVERIATGADDDVVADHDGRGGGEVFEAHVADFDMPALFAGFRVEADEVIVRGFEVEPIAIHAEAAAADVDAALRFPLVVPELTAGAGVDGPGVVGNGEVEHAVDFKRRGFHGDAAGRVGTHVDAVDPGERERAHVRGGDLLEGAEAAAGIIAVVGRPGVGGEFFEFGGVEALATEDSRGERQRDQGSHFLLTR